MEVQSELNEAFLQCEDQVLYAPLLSGGSVICCSAFDAGMWHHRFWDCVENLAPTWYYASPTMHQCILQAAKERKLALSRSCIELVCNAAGGLLPSLAVRLRDTFGCPVLPSYGMTECMPISTPPLDYALDRPGTSGINVGPEICILDQKGQVCCTNITGRIAVRGLPVFQGYLVNGKIDGSCFTEDGWFDTGDLGHRDDSGYLYITGRSKEAINRGVELISPFEVEEVLVSSSEDPASPTYGKISKALAFTVPHDVLQEVVGICIVTPSSSKRTSLHDIQAALKSKLAQVKIPSLVVFVESGLPTSNNKVMRIRLAERLGIKDISDGTSWAERHYEALAPPLNSPLEVPIKCNPVPLDLGDLTAALYKIVSDPLVEMHWSSPIDTACATLYLAPRTCQPGLPMPHPQVVERELKTLLHGYQMPSSIRVLEQPFPKTVRGTVGEAALGKQLHSSAVQIDATALNDNEIAIVNMFANILNVPINQINCDSDFFDLGGDSLKAGRLLAGLRKRFRLKINIDALFANPRITMLSRLVAEERCSKGHKPRANDTAALHRNDPLPGCEKTCSSTSPLLLFLQLLPICLFYPMRRAFTFTMFLYFLSWSMGGAAGNSIIGRLAIFVLSLFIAQTTTRTLAPLLAVTFKWIVIGRYRQGLYPMWGQYHTRWWLVQKALQIAGTGVFGTFSWSRCLYYRALGANVGSNVFIHKGATLGEYDLLTF